MWERLCKNAFIPSIQSKMNNGKKDEYVNGWMQPVGDVMGGGFNIFSKEMLIDPTLSQKGGFIRSLSIQHIPTESPGSNS